MIAPSAWVVQYATEFPKNARILDLACGYGRHARYLAASGWPVLAVDRDPDALASLSGISGVETLAMDLESLDWPLLGQRFSGVLVSNYLWRPHLAQVFSLLAPGGVLIYETFMCGNEVYGKPSRSDFLLRPGELRAQAVEAGLQEIAFFEGYVPLPRPARRQAICAQRPKTD